MCVWFVNILTWFILHQLGIQKHDDMSWHAAFAIKQITLLIETRQLWFWCGAAFTSKREDKFKTCFLCVLYNFQPQWLLFKLEHFPPHNNRNPKMKKQQHWGRYWCFTQLIHLLVLVCSESSSCYNKKTLLVWVSSVTHSFSYGFSCFDPCHLCLLLSLCFSSKVDIMNNSFLTAALMDLTPCWALLNNSGPTYAECHCLKIKQIQYINWRSHGEYWERWQRQLCLPMYK